MNTIQFTTELSAFQGILISADFDCPFKELSAKGGNEKKIESVIQTIRNFLKTNNYLNDKGIVKDAADTMRRFALYVVLNSDLHVLNELVSTDSSIDLLVWTVPTIPKCLMCEILWNLHMGDYVKEIITFSYPQLAIEVADAFILNMKYMNPIQCLQQLHILATACFNILCRVHFFDMEENLLKCAFNNFQRCMAYFHNPPNEHKLEELKKDDLYRYYGNCLHTMLSVLLECFTEYNTTQVCDLEDSVELYELTYNNKYTKKTGYKPCKCSNDVIVNILNECLKDLLDKCMELVKGINLDIFCAWSEFEVGGVTMQENVGELCYIVRETLLGSDLCEHPVVGMLEQISRKPVDIKEKINTTDSSVIAERVNQNDSESSQWFQALIHRDNLSQDLTLLEVLDSHLDQLDEGNAYNYFQKLQSNNVDVGPEVKEQSQILIIKLFQRCNTAVKHDIVDDYFKDRQFNNDMECSEFDCMLIEIFNKLAILPETDLSDVLSVLLQNPRQVYATIFKRAIENEQQTNLMFKVMEYLSKYSNHYYSDEIEPSLLIVLKSTLDQELNTNVKLDNMIKFICMLKNVDIIPASKLFLLIIMPKLHAALINKDYENMHLHCKLLRECFSVEYLLQYRVPVLAVLAQVMAQVRWKINTFNNLSPCILKLVIELQTFLITYEENIPEHQVSWLKRKIKNLKPLNMYYYRQLWNIPASTFVEVIGGAPIQRDMEIDVVAAWLIKVLCSCTLEEWHSIWESLKEFEDTTVLDLLHNAMMTVLITEKRYRTDASWECMLYCFRNLFNCMRYNYLKPPLSNDKVLNVTNKLLTLISNVEGEYLKEFGTAVMPLFAYIAERKDDYDIDVRKILEALPESELSVMILKLFRSAAP